MPSKLRHGTHLLPTQGQLACSTKPPTTPACTWWNRPEEDPSSGKLESTHPSRTSVKYDQVFFGVESIMRVNAASLDMRDATTSTPGTLNDLTADLIMANNNNNPRPLGLKSTILTTRVITVSRIVTMKR